MKQDDHKPSNGKSKFKNGYFIIDNQIANYLIKHGHTFKKVELLFIWTILRYTVGYHRNEVAFSLRELEKLTNIKHPNLWKAIKSLQERNIIYVKNNSKRKQRSIYGLNNLDEWKTNCDAIDNTCDAIDNSNCDAIDNTCDAIDNSLPKELNYSNK